MVCDRLLLTAECLLRVLSAYCIESRSQFFLFSTSGGEGARNGTSRGRKLSVFKLFFNAFEWCEVLEACVELLSLEDLCNYSRSQRLVALKTLIHLVEKICFQFYIWNFKMLTKVLNSHATGNKCGEYKTSGNKLGHRSNRGWFGRRRVFGGGGWGGGS